MMSNTKLEKTKTWFSLIVINCKLIIAYHVPSLQSHYMFFFICF